MKKLFFATTLLFIFSSFLCAQDTIILVKGDKIPAKILEISSQTVKYKNFSNLQGPDYILENKEIEMIRFQNGTTQQFNPIEADDDVEYINDIPIRKETSVTDRPTEHRPNRNQEERYDYPSGPGHLQSYREKKQYYNPRMYVREYGDPYNPVLAGVASYFLPGLGQIISGETGRGMAFMGGTFGSYLIGMIGLTALTVDSYDYNYYNSYYGNEIAGGGATLAIAGIVAGAFLHIYSIVDAVQVAKVNNMYRQDLRDNYVSFQLKPYVGNQNPLSPIRDNPVGLTLSLSF